jgi:hypothetical protein
MAETLFDYETKLITHRNDPDTSRQAAQKMIETSKLQQQEKYINDEIKKYHRLTRRITFTARELANHTEMEDGDFYYTIQRRLSGLHLKGYIERIIIGHKEDGKPIYKKRKNCCVWRLT